MSDGDGGSVRIVGAIAGVGSGLTKVAVGHGFDTIKTRLQCSLPGTYTGALDCLMKTVRNESVFALYKGASPPAVGWAIIDSVLLGSLHNYRLFLVKQGFTESVPGGVQERKRLTLFGHACAGLMAGCTSAFIAHPIELLKANLQLQLQRSPADRQFKGPIDCARQVIKAQGVIKGLWRGFPSSLLFRSSFFWMFGSVEVYMRLFSRLNGTRFQMDPGTATFFAGGFSAFTFWFFAIPFDNIKNRIMTSPLHTRTSSPLQVGLKIYATQGWRGFYAGFVPCLLRAFPVNASALFVYEGLMRVLGAEKTRH